MALTYLTFFVFPLDKRNTTFSWFSATPLVVNAGNYKVSNGKINLFVHNPIAASVTITAGVALAHFNLGATARH
eukprot:scaffold12703_cov101-Isochrysis_galbana.AAC.1